MKSNQLIAMLLLATAGMNATTAQELAEAARTAAGEFGTRVKDALTPLPTNVVEQAKEVVVDNVVVPAATEAGKEVAKSFFRRGLDAISSALVTAKDTVIANLPAATKKNAAIAAGIVAVPAAVYGLEKYYQNNIKNNEMQELYDAIRLGQEVVSDEAYAALGKIAPLIKVKSFDKALIQLDGQAPLVQKYRARIRRNPKTTAAVVAATVAAGIAGYKYGVADKVSSYVKTISFKNPFARAK